MDAHGDNSTAEQIVDAQLATTVTDPVTGKEATVLEQTLEQYRLARESMAGSLPADDPARRFDPHRSQYDRDQVQQGNLQ